MLSGYPNTQRAGKRYEKLITLKLVAQPITLACESGQASHVPFFVDDNCAALDGALST